MDRLRARVFSGPGEYGHAAEAVDAMAKDSGVDPIEDLPEPHETRISVHES